MPATTLNLLAGAWIQFEVHDWFSHGRQRTREPVGDPARRRRPVAASSRCGSSARAPIRARSRGAADLRHRTTRTGGTARRSTAATPAFAAGALRQGEHGKLQIDDRRARRRRTSRRTSTSTGVAGNFWVGLALLHSLFMREHNAVCDRLHEAYPALSDHELYDKARLVVAALMAKIHTVDWTPAIIAHPTTVLGMRANWWGLAGERLDKRFGRRTSNEVIRGIPGSPTNHHGVPYSLTEEFVCGLPDAPADPGRVQLPLARRRLRCSRSATLPELGALARAGAARRDVDDRRASTRSARSHPGAITLHNFPRFLQDFDTAGRRRSSTSPRSTSCACASEACRATTSSAGCFHLKPCDTFEEMTDNPEQAEELRRVYGDVEQVDTMIGMYAEPKPKGFGFSDTAFRVFILMASRRLESDRFFTTRLPARGLHAGGVSTGWRATRCGRSPAALPGARAGAARGREPVRSVGAGRRLRLLVAQAPTFSSSARKASTASADSRTQP